MAAVGMLGRLRLPLLRSDLPLSKDASGRFLPWLIGVMVYLAALALAGAMALDGLVRHWQQGLEGTLTVQIPREAGLSSAERDDRRLDVLAVLTGTPGVASAEALDDSQMASLLEPWLGPGNPTEDLPVPDLIAVTLEPGVSLDLDALHQQIAAVVPDAVLDDHARWLHDVVVFARSVQVVAGLIVSLIGLAAATTVVFVTRTGLAIHNRVIEIVHLIGAHDSYIARQFQLHALRLGFFGGAIGVICAAATLLGLQLLLRRIDDDLLPALAFSGNQWLLLAAVPVCTAVIALVTARVTVMQALERM